MTAPPDCSATIPARLPRPEERIVRPLQPDDQTGYLPRGGGCGHAGEQWQPATPDRWHAHRAERTENVSAARGGLGQVQPSRPRPAV